MRLQSDAHTSAPWRIHELTPDFHVEDVWALPTPGGPHDFPRLVRLIASFDPFASSSVAVRTLFCARQRLGQLLGLDHPAPDAPSESVVDRLPADLRETPHVWAFSLDRLGLAGVTPLYLTENEWAIEIANRTVDGILHLAWVQAGPGEHRGQLAVLVKRRGLLGSTYMAAITPFRYFVVYPQLLRELGRRWRAPPPDGA